MQKKVRNSTPHLKTFINCNVFIYLILMASAEPAADECFCKSCGEIIKKEAEICPKCGVRQKSASSQRQKFASSQKDRMTAGILGILLGSLGIHKFYLGKNALGIIYLCFCWTGIPTIVGFVEGIIYLFASDEEFQKKYVEK